VGLDAAHRAEIVVDAMKRSIAAQAPVAIAAEGPA
jgi:hypothetical protein